MLDEVIEKCLYILVFKILRLSILFSSVQEADLKKYFPSAGGSGCKSF